MRIICLAALAALAVSPAMAQSDAAVPGSPLIDYDGYSELTIAVSPVRKQRLVSLVDFNIRAKRSDTLVLDARSAQAFAEGHIAGAVNLPLPDFAADTLAEVIGANPGREILIYCNNNFTDNRRPVVTKNTQLALNIQTFINLYGYGYRNVFELGEAVSIDMTAVRWVKGPAA